MAKVRGAVATKMQAEHSSDTSRKRTADGADDPDTQWQNVCDKFGT